MRLLAFLPTGFVLGLSLFSSMVCLAPRPAWADKDLTIGITQYPANYHPSIESMLAKTYILSATRRPITIFDADWNLICMACETLPTLENGLAERYTTPEGKEGIKVTYTLKPDLFWGDGTPVTTKDVLHTWTVGKHPKSGFGASEVFRRILQIDVKDDRTFTLHQDRVTFRYNAINGFELLPAHLDAPFAENMDGYRQQNAYDADPTHPGLYFGPYVIAEIKTGAEVTLARNPHWMGKAPYFETISFRAIENTAALEANLLSDGIDMIAGELGLTVDQALAFEKRHGESFTVRYQPGLIYEHIDLMLDNPALRDVRVRQALLFGLNRELISERLFGGRQPVADSSINPLDWIHTKDLPTYAFDPKKAAALLDEAGYSDMKDGVRHNAAGEPLRFELMTTAGNRIRETVQQVLQSQWKAIGIDVRIKNEPPRVFFGETVTKRAFTGMAMFAWISSPESVPLTTLRSDHIPSPENNWAGQNYTGYQSAEMDRLIDAIEVELDRDKREALWHDLQRLYARDLPALPLYFRANPHVWPKGLEGITPTGHQGVSTLWIEDWRKVSD
ncbi:MAG: peptide ABC transporter substrate-binding protein [Magnetovibrionaceae bacterium]